MSEAPTPTTVKPTVPTTVNVSKGPVPTGGGAQRTPTPTNAKGAFTFGRVTSQRKGKYLKMLIYGPAGGGKTTLAGSACNIDESSDVLLVTAEGGDIVFENNERITRPELIDTMRAVRIEQIQKVYEWLARHVAFRDANDEVRLHKLQNIAFFGNPEITEAEAMAIDPDFDFNRIRRYKTVILDSLTDIEAQNMNHVLGIADEGFSIGDDLTPPGYTEFRKNNNTIQQLVRAFRNLDVHLIILCGQRFQQDEMKKFHYGPWLTGQLATQVQSFVDVVGYMVPSQQDPSQPVVRRLYVEPQVAVKFDAKCRIANFKDPFFQNPTFEMILQQCGYVKKAA